MVNGRQTRNLPGRKTDMQDCQWGATLHAHGLLRAGFVPPAQVRRLQDYMRLRADHISMAASDQRSVEDALQELPSAFFARGSDHLPGWADLTQGSLVEEGHAVAALARERNVMLSSFKVRPEFHQI